MAILAVSVAFGFQPEAEGVGLKAQPTSGAQLPGQSKSATIGSGLRNANGDFPLRRL